MTTNWARCFTVSNSAVNQQHKAFQQRSTGSKLMEMGWDAARIRVPSGTQRRLSRLYVVDWEVIVNGYGVAITKQQGHSWANALIVRARIHSGSAFRSNITSLQQFYKDFH